MADTALKFGPEWLRALSDRGPSQTAPQTPIPAPITKYKLADYRYGREEMLALFDNASILSEEMKVEIPNLTSPSCQLPLALVSMTEDEHRLWSRSVNSDAVLRLSNKERGLAGPVVGPPAGLERPPPERTIIRDPIRGRGGIVADRGRGRGGRGFYQRGLSFEDDADPSAERRDFRPKGFEGTRAAGLSEDLPGKEKAFERPFRTSESEDSKTPRKTDPRAPPESWRGAPRTTEDRGSWRARGKDEPWSKPTASWRDERNDDGMDSRNGQRRTGNSYQRDWDEGDDGRNNLPEWSLDDAGATVGTFDASGAFREGSPDGEDKDDGGEWKKVSKPSRSDNNRERNNRSHRNDDRDRDGPRERNLDSTSRNNAERPRQEIKREADGREHASNNSSNPAPIRHRSADPTPVNDNSHFEQAPKNNRGRGRFEEEGFSHLEQEAESMVAMWTADEDPKESEPKQVSRAPQQPQAQKPNTFASNHENFMKWFYRDPQDEIQGPFTSQEMLEWFNAGYFTMDLLVRRGCDEKYSQLGELIKIWGRVPFSPGQELPALRLAPSPPPIQQHLTPQHVAAPRQIQSGSISPAADQMRQFLNQQQQAQQRQALEQQHMQNQLRQLLSHLKSQEGFSDLSQHEQQEILVQQYAQQVQQRHLQQQQQQALALNHDSKPLIQLDQRAGLVQQRLHAQHPANMSRQGGTQAHSIWELSNGGAMTASALEELQRKEQELEELKKRKLLEEEHRLRLEAEENRRKLEEEQIRRIELQKQLERQEEERKRTEELMKRQEEEIRLRRMREAEERMEEEKRRFEEQRRRQEEMQRLDEMARRQKEEAEKRKKEEEMERFLQIQQQQQELERQRAKQQEAERQRMQREQQEAAKRAQDKKVWGSQPVQAPASTAQVSGNVSLAEIQRLQEEKEREERKQQQAFHHQQMQALFQQQQQQQQALTKQQQLTWAASSAKPSGPSVKTLAEIQKEEADKLSKQRAKEAELRKDQPPVMTNVGIWSNAASQLSWKSSQQAPPSSSWNIQPSSNVESQKGTSNPSLSGGFWDQDEPGLPSSVAVKQPVVNSGDSAFRSNKNVGNGSANKSSASTRTRKDEEAVLKIFKNPRQKSDEFTTWCEEALSKFESTLDVPTFVEFLKETESPYEVNDYVRSYLGETKDSRDFAKQFLEKRSFFRNKAKKQSSDELMWGPAPAITPTANKGSAPQQLATAASHASNNGDSSADATAKASKVRKGKKGKRIDNSILGFTVQADPDRINAGEIEQLD